VILSSWCGVLLVVVLVRPCFVFPSWYGICSLILQTWRHKYFEHINLVIFVGFVPFVDIFLFYVINMWVLWVCSQIHYFHYFSNFELILFIVFYQFKWMKSKKILTWQKEEENFKSWTFISRWKKRFFCTEKRKILLIKFTVMTILILIQSTTGRKNH
jgi:hypothetical protein